VRCGDLQVKLVQLQEKDNGPRLADSLRKKAIEWPSSAPNGHQEGSTGTQAEVQSICSLAMLGN
jgi:hypothetical protein